MKLRAPNVRSAVGPTKCSPESSSRWPVSTSHWAISVASSGEHKPICATAAASSASSTRPFCRARPSSCCEATCRGSGGGVTGSTKPSLWSSSSPAARISSASSSDRNVMLRLEPARRPVRPRRCSIDATVDGAPIWMTLSRSPTSIPSSSVDVDTMTQFLASANALSARRRSSRDSDEWETNVSVPRSRMRTARSSTVRRESAKTSRFSPAPVNEMTVAALPTLPTWSRTSSGTTVAAAGGAMTAPARSARDGPWSHDNSSSALPTVADRPMR